MSQTNFAVLFSPDHPNLFTVRGRFSCSSLTSCVVRYRLAFLFGAWYIYSYGEGSEILCVCIKNESWTLIVFNMPGESEPQRAQQSVCIDYRACDSIAVSGVAVVCLLVFISKLIWWAERGCWDTEPRLNCSNMVTFYYTKMGNVPPMTTHVGENCSHHQSSSIWYFCCLGNSFSGWHTR